MSALHCEQGDGLRVDVFDKVERVFLLGLRASDPAMRRKFFDLYNSAIPVTLFDRLRFIVCSQDWEHLADTFWLKQGLVRALFPYLCFYLTRVVYAASCLLGDWRREAVLLDTISAMVI